MVTIEIEGLDKINQKLLRVQERVGNMYPLMTAMGENLVNTTKERFETSTAPDGSRWASNSQSTYLALLGKSHTNKSGRLNKRGISRVQSKRPLILNDVLHDDIHAQVTANTLIVGTSQKYATTQHFGAKKGEFGTSKRGNPLPWGDIPARPFLGMSDTDKRVVSDMIGEYLIDAINR